MLVVSVVDVTLLGEEPKFPVVVRESVGDRETDTEGWAEEERRGKG